MTDDTFRLGMMLLVVISLSAGSALVDKRAFERVMANQAEQREAQIAIAASVKDAMASRDREIERLNARIDELWREFYEALEARQPVLGKGGKLRGKITGRRLSYGRGGRAPRAAFTARLTGES